MPCVHCRVVAMPTNNAVLQKHLHVPTSRLDVFVSAMGGMRLQEPAADLAVMAALVSSYWDHPLPADTVFIGEVGLAGEVRPVPNIARRVQETIKLGFRRIVLPAQSSLKESKIPAGVKIVRARSIAEAFAPFRPRKAGTMSAHAGEAHRSDAASI